MLHSTIILFLFGATIISGHVLRNGLETHHPLVPEVMIQEMPTSYNNEITIPKEFGSASLFRSFLPQFMQQGSNLFYKPQFVLPPMHYQPASPIETIIEKDCDDKKTPVPVLESIIYEEPIPETHVYLQEPKDEIVEVKPIAIPPPPALPSFTMPELPTVVFEVPNQSPSQPISSEPQIIEIPVGPELPSMPELSAPIIVEAEAVIPESPSVIEVIPEIKPMEIPAPPELGPFVMPVIHIMPEAPEQPEIIEVLPSLSENNKPAPVEIAFKPISLPEAPTLKPFVMPSIPEHVVPNTVYEESCNKEEIEPAMTVDVLPPAPALPPFVMPAIPTIQYTEEEKASASQVLEVPEAPIIEIKPPMTLEIIPPAPQLPPFVMPALPIIQNIEENKAPAPQIFEIPSAPELPPMPALSAPIIVEAEPVIPESPSVIEVIPEIKPMEIPAPPELGPFVMPVIQVIPEAPKQPEIIEALPSLPENNKPAPVEIAFKPISLPEAPTLKPFVMPSIPEHVVPNTVYEEPCNKEEIEPAMTIDVLPPAPALPPFVMPAMPTIQYTEEEKAPATQVLEVPDAPMLPPFAVPEFNTPITVEVLPPASQLVENDKPTPIDTGFIPMNIPEPPLLKPFVMPSIPETVLVEVSKDSEKPCYNDRTDSLPSAPLLPPYVMTRIPMIEYI